MAVVAGLMGILPNTVTLYVAGNLAYAFALGMAYAAFTALVLDAMGPGAGATKYNIFASLSNFPLWWLGLLLGQVAEVAGSPAMLFAEGLLGLLGIGLFVVADRALET